MSKNLVADFLRSAISCAMVCAALLTGARQGQAAGDCPTSTDSINTDRPGLTNSSLVVPYGSFQAENGIDWMVSHGSNLLGGSSARLRLGVAHCTEFLVDVPSYVGSINGSQSSGFSDVVVSFKRQLPVPFGFDLSATAGLGFPSGSSKISSHGYQPYIQAPWLYKISDAWTAAGMFTLSWFPSESTRNPTFGSVFALGRDFGPAANASIEYGGTYDHQRPTQVLDTLAQWRFTNTQQIDFQAGFGLNSSSVDHFFGIGYSFRLDGVFGGAVGNSP
jgi:Putative MetA-pathway of phenol degradation